MKKILFILFVLNSLVYSQQYKIGIWSSLNSSLLENFLNLAIRKPTQNHIYLFGFDLRAKILESIPIYSGISFQFGQKNIFSWNEPFNTSIDNLELSHVKINREITLLYFKIPVLYTIHLSKNVQLNSVFCFGWNQLKLNNTSDMILVSGTKFTDADDQVIN